MRDSHLFEYAVIRIVPRPEREEFINAGVILYCSAKRFLSMAYTIQEARILALDPKVNLEEIKHHLLAFKEICCGDNTSSPISKLDNASRFRWLTATRSTVVQTSRVHPGLCEDPQTTLDRLMLETVG